MTTGHEGRYEHEAGDEKSASHRRLEASHGQDAGGRQTEEVVVLADERLSGAQQQILDDLTRLYQSLCGKLVGHYSPQALLDSVGQFNRPVFPGFPPGGTKVPPARRHHSEG